MKRVAKQKKKYIPEFWTLRGLECGDPHDISWVVYDGEVLRDYPEPDMQDDFDDLVTEGTVWGDYRATGSARASESTKGSCNLRPSFTPCKLEPKSKHTMNSDRGVKRYFRSDEKFLNSPINRVSRVSLLIIHLERSIQWSHRSREFGFR